MRSLQWGGNLSPPCTLVIWRSREQERHGWPRSRWSTADAQRRLFVMLWPSSLHTATSSIRRQTSPACWPSSRRTQVATTSDYSDQSGSPPCGVTDKAGVGVRWPSQPVSFHRQRPCPDLDSFGRMSDLPAGVNRRAFRADTIRSGGVLARSIAGSSTVGGMVRGLVHALSTIDAPTTPWSCTCVRIRKARRFRGIACQRPFERQPPCSGVSPLPEVFGKR